MAAVARIGSALPDGVSITKVMSLDNIPLRGRGPAFG